MLDDALRRQRTQRRMMMYKECTLETVTVFYTPVYYRHY